MNGSTKKALNDKRAVLLYFGDDQIPAGLVFDNQITMDTLDNVVDKIKSYMKFIIENDL